MTAAVKICGITRLEDALAALKAGAHALGFIFYSRSPRHLSLAQAAAILRAIPPYAAAVGVFVDPTPSEVEAAIAQVPITLLQFHGAETPEFCAQFRLPYIKALRVKAGIDLLQYARRYAAGRGLLLDAHVTGVHGGSGTAFDWTLVPNDLPLPIVLSGGLSPANVGAAIRRVRPYAVDVSSGVEVSPGIKDADKIAAFMKEVRSADV